MAVGAAFPLAKLGFLVVKQVSKCVALQALQTKHIRAFNDNDYSVSRMTFVLKSALTGSKEQDWRPYQ